MTQILSERKLKIQQTAQNLFGKNGYNATSMRALAKIVGIEPASLYSHITSKEILLQDICFQIANEFLNALKNVTEKQLNPEEKLSAAIAAHINIILKHLDASTVFFYEWKHLNHESLITFKKLRTQYENQFRKILEEGINHQFFKNTDPHISIKILFGMMNSIHEWYHPRGKSEQDFIIKNITDTFLIGIKK